VKGSRPPTPARSFVTLPRGALAKLGRADPRMGRLVRRVGPCRLETGRSGGFLAALVRSIVYQQLSGKAASAILARVRALFVANVFPDPRAILARSERDLRACGLSRQKVASLRDLCEKVVAGRLPLDRIEAMPDDAIIDLLTGVQGIGQWSAQMFLIFDLGRLDVWPATDLGIRKAVALLYDLEELPKPGPMVDIGKRFSPYRSVASWYFWRLLDGGKSDW
jgi:DNA-3-methyladenine glycosylase II